MTRLFFALKIPQHPAFMELYEDLSSSGSGIKAVNPENQHLTLKFIGEPACSVDDIKAAPRMITENYAPFSIGVKGVGAFPNWRRPSVLWVGLESVGRLRKMVVELDIDLNKKCNINRERRDFKAHITVGRVKDPIRTDLISIRASMERCLGKLIEDDYTIDVDGFSLFNSELTTEGPKYTMIGEYPLNGP